MMESKNDVLVSVIMSLYKEPLVFAERSIYSMLTQTYKNIELIVALDNPDNIELNRFVKSISKKDNRIVIIENNNNIGLPCSLNNCLLKAKGKYIARMDGDDISLKERIETQINFLRENMLIDLVGTNAWIIDEEENIIGQYTKPISDKGIKFFMKKINGPCIMHPTWLARKQVFAEIGGYRNLKSSQDYDFLLRAMAKGFRFSNIPINLIKYRKANESISQKKAYQQYLNANLALSTYKKAIKMPDKPYPEITLVKCDLKKEQKFLKSISAIVKLRIAISKKQYLNAIKLIFESLIFNYNPIKIRIKSNLVMRYIKLFLD